MKSYKNKKAQATLEVVLTFAVLILFLLGMFKTMAWFGGNLGSRAQYYQSTRAEFGASPTGAANLGYSQSPLSLFKE